MRVLRRFTGGAFLLLLATFGLSQQTVIITGPRELTGPLTIRVIPPAPAPPPSAPVIATPTPLPDGDINEPYSINLAATGGTLPYSWYLTATETLPQNMEEWTPVGGELAFVETFGDPDCSATDNVWPTPAGLVIANSGLLTGNCLGRIDGADSAVAESGLGLNNTWYSFELIYTTLPSTTSTAIAFMRSTTGNLGSLRWSPTNSMQTITSAGGTAQNIFEPLADTRYKIELYGERGVIAADAKAHARVATFSGGSYGAFGAWVESNNGTWTELIDNLRLPANANGGVWYIDTIERCQFGPVSEDFCGASAPDLYTTPSTVPNNVYVDNSTVPISESLWSHDGTDLTLEIATDPDLSTIEVAEKPGGTLTLSQSGVLSGTPTADGTLNFTARVCDAVGSCSTKAFSLDINPPPDPEPPGAWVASFPTPLRTHYVTASGGCTSGGTCGEIGNPETLAHANGHDVCGDLHILRGGTYVFASQVGSNTWGPNLNCTSGAPSVWKGYVNPATGQPEQVTTDGSLRPTGSHQWFVNLETLTTTDALNTINVRGTDMKLINGFSHNSSQDSNVAPQNLAERFILYGYSMWRPAASGIGGSDGPSHNIYTNGNCASGMKYIVHNISQELVDHSDSRHLLQINDNSYKGAECYHLEGNFWGDAAGTPRAGVLISPTDIPANNITIHDDWFVDIDGDNPIASLYFGVATRPSPITLVMTDNYLARVNLGMYAYWGDSGAHDPSVFTGNEIYDARNGVHIFFQTKGVTGDFGSHKLPNQDVWDNNIYGGTFNAQTFCNGTNFGNSTLTQWRTRTDGCRVTPGSAGFDLNSTVVANPTVDKVRVIKNQYQCPTCTFDDGAWGFVHCVNWDGNTTCEADISSVVGVGKTYQVKYSRDPYGTAAASGTCPGSGACNVSLPTRRSSAEATGKFANAYFIFGEP